MATQMERKGMPNAGSPSKPPVPVTAAPEKPKAPKVDKRVKLHELANQRVSRAIKYVKLCGNLANYEPTDAEAARILKALTQAVDEVEARFTAKLSGKTEEAFTL